MEDNLRNLPKDELEIAYVRQGKEERKILGEIIEKRDKYVKHFLKEDLTFEAAIYDEAVHYLKGGKWRDIDNSMIETKDEEDNTVFENKDNDFKVRIAKKVKSKGFVIIKEDDYEISWGIDNSLDSEVKIKNSDDRIDRGITKEAMSVKEGNIQKRILPKLSSSVGFSNVYPNIDLQYNLKSDALKENVIIREKAENLHLKFNLAVKNLVPRLQEDNSIIFYDKQDSSKAIFKINSPAMYDKKMALSEGIKVTLEEENNVYILSLVPDDNWLKNKEREYPIVIDPTVITEQKKESIFDSYVSSAASTTNYGSEVILKVGRGASSGVTRSYIKFKLPTDKLTTGDMVIAGYLDLWMAAQNNDVRQINVHKVLSDWDEGSITWNNVPAVDNDKIQDYNLVKGNWGTQMTWDITRVVKYWLASGENYGIMLKNSDETVGYNQFFSSNVSEYDENGNHLADARPRIRIDYINNSGLENYWTFHNQKVGRAGIGYVNDYSGNLIFVHNDVAMGGNKMPITLNHVFNSNDRNSSMGYGLGWRLNLNQKVDFVTIGEGQFYVYTDEDGTKHYFYYDTSTGTYKEQLGSDLTFTKNSDNSYIIKDKNGGALEFLPGGYLYKIKDKNDNTITLNYDGTVLKKITDGAGRVTTLDVLSNGYLVGIIDPSGRRTSFAYNGIQLSKITYPDENYTLFSYDNNNNLTNAINYDGYNVVYTYYTEAPYRVKSIKEFGTDGTPGGSLDIQYDYNTTTFTDAKGRKNIYQFTDYGTTASIKDDDESAELYKYYNSNKYDQTTPNLYNKLNSTSKMQKFVKNYLKNHGAEKENSDWSPGNSEGREINAAFTTDEAYIGQRSLRIIKKDISSRDFYEQLVTNLNKGKNYVFSAYIKTADVTKINNKGATLFVVYHDTLGNCNTIDGNSYVQGSNDWVRQELKFTLPDNTNLSTVKVSAGIIQETGTVYFDCLQLEDGDIPSRYNIVENADFSYDVLNPLGWTKDSQSDINDRVVVEDNRQSYKIVGSQGKQKYLLQEFIISGKVGDSFIASAWAKGDSVPLNDPSLSLDKVRRFSLEVGLEKADNTGIDWFLVSFNEDLNTWQYVSNIIVAKNNYKRVILYLEYYNNLNTAYFTNVQLYKEEYGASYSYDNKGNIVSVASLAKQESNFEYDGNNDLIKATTPTSGVFKYEYDDKRNLKKATSAMQIPYTFTYDSSGNPLTSTAGKADGESPIFMQSSASYSISGNYTKSVTDGEDNSIINHYNEQKDLLIGITDPKGNKTTYNYDNMDRLISTSKMLLSSDSRNLEKFPLATNTEGSKGTKPLEENAVFDKDDNGKAVFAAFDTGINLLANSSFENGTSPWQLLDWDNSTGRWRIAADGVNGSSCLECYDSDGLTNGSATNSVAYQVVTLQAALTTQKPYTLSVYSKKIGTDNPVLGIRCLDITSSEIPGGYQNYEKPIAQNQWFRISNTFTLPIGTKSFYVILRSAVRDNNKVRFDAAQMEENNIYTPYTLDTRNNSKLYYDLGLDKKSGTMSMWFNTKGSGTRIIFSNENAAALFNLYINSDNKIILNSLKNDGSTQNIITVNDITISNNTWYFTALKWQWTVNQSSSVSTLSCTLYINDKVYTGAVNDFKDFTGVISALGSNVYGKYELNGFIESFAYSRKALTDGDIKSLYNRSMPEDIGSSITNNYGYKNDRIETITHNGFNYKFEYDSLGNNNKVYVGDQTLITNNFDNITGNLISSQYANNQSVSLEYDNLDRITARKFMDETRYTYKYDGNGNLAYHEDRVNNKNYRYIYDLSDRLVRVNELDPANPNNINYTKFSRDKNNNETRVFQRINGNLYETKYEYDEDNKQAGVFYGDGIDDNEDAEYFSFRGNTQGSKGTSPTEQNAVYGIDEDGKPILYAYPGTKVVYNLGISRIQGTMTAWANISMGGRGSRIIIANEGTNSNLFNVYVDDKNKLNLGIMDGTGNFTSIITTEEELLPGQWYFTAVSWLFDGTTLHCTLYLNGKHCKKDVAAAGFRDFTGVKTAVGSNISGDYVLKGLVKRFSFAAKELTEPEILKMYHGSRVKYEYNTRIGMLERKKISIGLKEFEVYYGYEPGNKLNSTTNRLSSIQNKTHPINYEYDDNGNIVRISEAATASDPEMNILYYYNELNELIQEDNQVLNKTIIYNYDAGGNIKNKLEINYGSGVQRTTTYGYDSVWKDKLTSYNGTTITYDEIGNLKTYNGYTYNWEEGRQLKYIVGSSRNIIYKYNDAGIRTEKNIDGIITKYYLSGNKVTFEDNGTDRIYYTYDSHDNLISMNLNGVEYYYIRNGQGDIIGLFDNTTTQVVKYVYDTWGKLISIKDANGVDVTNNTAHVGYKNPYRYRGYRYDNETGLYYLNSRYYNPEWGRYINADAVAGGTGILLSHNVFAYAMNNPVNMTDPNGYWPQWFNNAVASVRSDVAAAYNWVVGVVTEIKAGVSKKVAEAKVATKKIVVRALDAAVAFSGSSEGQTLSGYADSEIGKKIVSAAERNSANAWHAKPIGTWAISKLPEESKLLAFGKNLTNKGVGVTATVSLGVSAWDDFYHHGTRVGSKRFAVDVTSTLVNVGIGLILASTIGPGLAVGIGIVSSIGLGKMIFTPWKESIN
ncbi:DNRLRE domain-containing protein [Clostridium thailandense]|uniref:DNRLRE domain-containing protein n=1 Tax=Clostridium thailandense TaxID=2794346 RepID=UPI003989DC74